MLDILENQAPVTSAHTSIQSAGSSGSGIAHLNVRRWPAYRVLRQFWALVAALIGMPIALIAVIILNGLNIWRGLGSGDQLSILVVMLTPMAALLVALAFAFVNNSLRSQEHEEGLKSEIAEQHKMLIDLHRENEELRHSHATAAMRAHSDVATLSADVRAIWLRTTSKTAYVENDHQPWVNQAPSSVYTAVNPQFKHDVRTEFDEKGETRFIPVDERLRAIYLPRLHRELGISCYRIILFGFSYGVDTPPSDQLMCVLSVMRRSRHLANETGTPIALSRVQVYFHPSPACGLSIFVGVRETKSGGQPIAMSYITAARDFSLARLLIDDRVMVFHDRHDVEDLRRSADALCHGLRPYSISELESAYSRFLPSDEGGDPNSGGHVVAFDDHLSIQRNV